MSFIKFLTAVGHDFEKGLNFLMPFAAAATPIVALADPAIAPAYAAVDSLVQNVVLQTEQKFTAMGKQTGTGASKLAEVVQIVTPGVTQILSGVGVKSDSGVVSAWVNAVVALLNAYPATEQVANGTKSAVNAAAA